jgi:hypothetical protein
MTDKQINIVEILAEQCKNCTLYEGDTVSLNISIFDRQLKGVCFNNNIYFSVDELNYIMQKLISKEQECGQLKCLLEGVQKSLEVEIEERSKWSQLETEARYELLHKEQECEGLKEEIKKHNDDMFKNPPEKRFYCKGCTLPYISKKLKQTLTEIKEIIHFNKTNRLSGGAYISIEQILQKISECEGNDVRS